MVAYEEVLPGAPQLIEHRHRRHQRRLYRDLISKTSYKWAGLNAPIHPSRLLHPDMTPFHFHQRPVFHDLPVAK